jgi:5-guanidino-2-oxopentanoate decarboxylase
VNITAGEATMRLLAHYGVDRVYGVPGVHTLDFCRGLGSDAAVRHIQARNEQGAGFMAEGHARATGLPGVALVISGPGVTNAATALGQCYADSLPMLLISAEPVVGSIGKGWGVLHEITEQKAVTAPLTAWSATAYRAADIPVLLAQAFSLFASERPRPVHISIPIDVQAELVADDWSAVIPPPRAEGSRQRLEEAARWLRAAERPLILCGGGAVGAAGDLQSIAEALGALVIASTAGKGIVADDHPLSLSASTVRAETRAYIAQSDCLLAVGTELSETDSFVERLEITGRLIRIDLDPKKMNDLYPADLAIVGDAGPAMAILAALLSDHKNPLAATQAKASAAAIRQRISDHLSASEKKHTRLLMALRACCPAETVFSGDACQLVYTGAFAMPVLKPRQWFYPAGYCALGNGLPNGIGAKLALPSTPVVVLAGDGGFMFTVQELMTAAELDLPLPIIIWENGGLKQIQDDLDARGIERVGVEGANPDFELLARAFGCHAVRPDGLEAFQAAVVRAFQSKKPTVITVHEEVKWLA